MSSRLPRFLLLALALQQAVLGFWAAFAPRSFYDSFPGGGRQWVSANGPYNEHLATDVGALSLALVVVLLGAVWLADPRAMAIAAAAFLASAIPHLVFHLRGTDTLSTGDRVAGDAGQVLTILVALFVLANSIKESRKWPASTSSPKAPAAPSSVPPTAPRVSGSAM